MAGKLGPEDYPLAEKRPDLVRSANGRRLDEISIDAVLAGEIGMEDLRITPAALREQAEIAQAAGRPALADNFRRAAELVSVPQDYLMEVYELLRPGRNRDRAPLDAAAIRLREEFGARLMADFVTEAADVYERRGVFTFRY